MDKYIYENITWGDFKALDGNSIDKTFEFLCADFMKIKFDFDRVPLPSQNESYPGIEGEPIEKDGSTYGYQSKYSDDAFAKDKGFEKSLVVVADNITKSAYKIDTLCLFSKKDCPISSRAVKDKYFTDYETTNNVKIQKFFGNEFISEIKQGQYCEILGKYFSKDKLTEELYAKSRDEDNIDKVKLQNEIDEVINGFEGDRNLYENDVKIAAILQKGYSYRKLAYASNIFALNRFEKLENFVADKTFDILGVYEYDNLDDYLEKGVSILDGENDIVNNFKSELSHMISNKKGIFVNYGTQKMSSLNYLEPNKIKFINKQDGNNI